MNEDTENNVKQHATCLEYHHMQPQGKMIPYKLPCKPWNVVSADICMINNNMLLCIVTTTISSML